MQPIRALATISILAGHIAWASAMPLHVTVHAPAGTPSSASIYLAGSAPILGNWRADGVPLTRQDDGTYTADVDVQPGQSLEFKVTRGDWASVEKNADGTERANRTFNVDTGTTDLDIVVDRWASDSAAPTPAHTVTGTLQLQLIEARALKQPRTIRVWLPPNYDVDVKQRFSVLYMQDGQNCFDRATSAFGNEWQIDESLAKLINEKRIPPLIVVGVDNGLAQRTDEFTYTVDDSHGGGHAAAYTDFLLNEVKPYIDKTYRTCPDSAHTYIGGSSLGALISLEIARRHPNIFGGVLAMSPSLWWADESPTKAIDRDPAGLSEARVWVDMGTREGGPHNAADTENGKSRQYVEAARRLDVVLTNHHIEHHLQIDDVHAEHNESAWASRFPDAITYLLHAAN